MLLGKRAGRREGRTWANYPTKITKLLHWCHNWSNSSYKIMISIISSSNGCRYQNNEFFPPGDVEVIWNKCQLLETFKKRKATENDFFYGINIFWSLKTSHGWMDGWMVKLWLIIWDHNDDQDDLQKGRRWRRHWGELLQKGDNKDHGQHSPKDLKKKLFINFNEDLSHMKNIKVT